MHASVPDNKSCEGAGTLRISDTGSRYLCQLMVKKLETHFKTINGQKECSESPIPKSTALQVELAQVASMRLKRSLTRLTGRKSHVLLSYVNSED